MPKIDDRMLMPTHVVEIVRENGKVETQGPVPQDVARAQAAAYRGRPGIRTVRVVSAPKKKG